MHDGAGIAAAFPPRPDRLALAFAAGGLVAPPAGDLLVMRAVSGAVAAEVDPARLRFEQSFRPVHDALAAEGLRVTAREEGPAAMAVVVATRARAETLGNLARALALAPPGATVALDGAKTDGIDGIAKQAERVLPLAGSFAKAHGRVVWMERPEALPAEVGAWAAAAALRRNAAGFLAAPGMFSPEGPDPGSRRLAEAFDGRLAGRVADLGAGWGWLAHEALARCPSITAIDLFEAEARALEAARVNVADPRAGFRWADATRLGPADGPYDAVIANPPFHRGRAAAPELGAAFVAAAARILKPGGELLMVANRQLPYEAALDVAFARWDRLGEDGAFKLFVAERPRRR